MALLVTFSGPQALAAVYDQVMKELDAIGLGTPDGRRSHFAAIDDSGLTVADVWETPEQLDSFAAKLVPIIAGLGAPAPDVVARPIYNTLP